MALNISPVHRNLHTRVSWFYLEFEDWFVVIGLAAVTNVFGRWIDRNIFGIPMNVFLQYVVPVLSVPFLMLFKYGKPRGYLKDLLAWHAKPRIYCGMEPDSQIDRDYLAERDFEAGDCSAAWTAPTDGQLRTFLSRTNASQSDASGSHQAN